MEQRLLHTPEGVRDIYSGEYARKKALLQKLHRVVSGDRRCHIWAKYKGVSLAVKKFIQIFGRSRSDLSAEYIKIFKGRCLNITVTVTLYDSVQFL